MENNFVRIKGEIIKIINRKKDKQIIKCNLKVYDHETKFSILRINFIGDLAKEFSESYQLGDELIVEGFLRSSRFLLDGKTNYSVDIQAKKII